VKLPRDLSGWKITNALKRPGFTQDNQEGSQIRLTKGRLKVTVQNHRTVLPKTLKSILRQAEITINELISVI
jgi:predicted RNA binding protein YcfA (HicA-like mRNA interferase family)